MDEKEKGVKVEDPKAPEDQEGLVVDHAEELKRVQEERDNYKKGMLDAKDILKGKGIITDPEELKKLVNEQVEERMSTFATNFSKSTIESTLSSLSSTDAEKELIKFHYENSIVKTGLDPVSVRNDLENAKLLANKKAFFKQTKEMEIALTHKANMAPIGMGSSHQDSKIQTDDFFTPEQISELRKKGYDDAKIQILKKNMAKVKER